MSNNDIRQALDNIENYDKLNDYLDHDFTSTLDIIFDELEELVNNHNKNNSLKVDKLLTVIESSIENLDNEKLDMIVINCLEFKDNNEIKDKKISLKFDNLLNSIYYENSDDYKFDIMSFLNYLIYKDKSIKRLKIFLDNIDNNFNTSKYFDDIFVKLLYNFDTTDRELKNYYYRVSILLMEKMSNTLLLKNRDRYLYILDNLKIHSEYTDDIVKLLNGEYIDDKELLNRFNLSFEFPYLYKNINLLSKDSNIPNLKQQAITIDTNNTYKMDDAIYFKKNKDNTYTLYVHVSYIPSIVEYDSIINEVARDRAKSLLVFNKIIPIYPNELVLKKCSLVRNDYKNTITYSLKLDRDLKIIHDTLKISRTNVRMYNNYSYEDINNIIVNNSNRDLNEMLKYLTIFTINNKKNNKLDVERLLKDNNYYQELLDSYKDKNISKEIIRLIMREINYNSAKYFRDRELPYLYKCSSWDYDKARDLEFEASNNKSVSKDSELLNKLNESFIKIELSADAKRFFDLDCYSSSTDPLWKYSSAYNQYLIDKFVFGKDLSSNLKSEWYNNTRNVAQELNMQRWENKNIGVVCKKLSRIRKMY